MYNWLGNQVGFNVANFIFLVLGLLCVIIAIIIVMKIIRRLTSGTYIAGGKDRKPRLSVKDALPIDKTRQIVLISCDNVEHLIMIGGPNDLLIETSLKKQIINEDSKRIEPQIKIDSLSSDINNQTQNKQPIHSEPNFASHTQDDTKLNPTMRSPDLASNLSADPFQETTDKTNINAQTVTSTRLHPTYPLKQVSAGIYSNRSNARSIAEIEKTAEKSPTMRIENPYHKDPNEQNNFVNQEQVRKIEPEFSSESQKQAMSFPTNILKNRDSNT